MKWIALEDELPNREEHYCVLLFPCKSDVGILYITSNVEYARGPFAKQAGYTHWAAIELAPDHQKWQDWQNNYIMEQELEIAGIAQG